MRDVVDEIISLLHAMDDEAQAYMLATARRQAERNPRHRRPTLRLVNGKVSAATLGSNLGSVENVGLAPVG